MSATAKLYLSLGLNYVPQMDFQTRDTENGGIEATQSFLVRKFDVGVGGALVNFRRGTRLEVVDPNCPALYRNLTVKSNSIVDHAPGMMRAETTFTGYAYAATGGSSGGDETVPTYTLEGSLEEAPLNEHPEWEELTSDEKWALGNFLAGVDGFESRQDYSAIGMFEEFDNRNQFYPVLDKDGANVVFSERAKKFIKLIAQDKKTFKRPAWTYTQRIEGSSGFTSAQLNTTGKIVRNPPGGPQKPSGGYTWLGLGPFQEQSGPNRFIKSLPFLLIRDSEENQFLYD